MPRGVYDHFKIRGRTSKYRIPFETRICAREECNTTFEVMATSKRKYCSRSCANQTTWMTRKRDYTISSTKGKKRPPFSKTWKENISKAKKGKCSGSKNNNWKGGVTEEIQIIRTSAAHKIWSRSVLERDNFTCQYCGKRDGKRLVAHHIKSFIDYPEDRFSIDNGITLHNSCHIYLHNMIRRNDPDADIIQRVIGYRILINRSLYYSC